MIPAGTAAELGRRVPGDAPGCGRVWGWALPGPAKVGSAILGGEAEGPAGADPSPGDMPVALHGPELPEGWEESERTDRRTMTTAAGADSLWTFCLEQRRCPD